VTSATHRAGVAKEPIVTLPLGNRRTSYGGVLGTVVRDWRNVCQTLGERLRQIANVIEAMILNE
jgi:hypothetical protein